MKPSIMTKKQVRNLVLIFSLTLLATIACESKDVPATENASSPKKVDEEVSTKKDAVTMDSTKSSQVAVTVNGTKLTQDEIDSKINKTLETLKGRVPSDQMENFKQNMQKKIIDDFITRTLLSQEADKQNIAVDDDEIKQAMSEIEAKIPEGMTLETVLKQGGISVAEMRDNIRFSLRANKLFESQIKTDYTPTGEEIKTYYTDNKKKFDTPEQVHARHILIKSDDKDTDKTKEEKKTKIESLRKQLLEGADFEKLAKENSECPSGQKGGDLGTFTRGRMVKPFEDAAFNQKLNEIGPVIQTNFGYHIIQVLEHDQAKQKTLEEANDTIKETLVNRRQQELTKNYLDELKKKANIVYGTADDSKK